MDDPIGGRKHIEVMRDENSSFRSERSRKDALVDDMLGDVSLQFEEGVSLCVNDLVEVEKAKANSHRRRRAGRKRDAKGQLSSFVFR